MSIDQSLDAALRAWGHAQVNRYAVRQAPGDRTQAHPLQQAMDVAPGTVERAMARLSGRDGHSRRTFMARDIPGKRIVPTWACDAVPCHDDAGRPRDLPEQAHDMGIPDDLRWVDDAIRRLSRVSEITAAVLSVEFTAPSTARQAARARMVAERTGIQMQARRYRSELRSALQAVAAMKTA